MHVWNHLEMPNVSGGIWPHGRETANLLQTSPLPRKYFHCVSEYTKGVVINNPLQGNHGTQLEVWSKTRAAIYFECDVLTASPCFFVNYARNRITNILLLMKDCGKHQLPGGLANLILASWNIFWGVWVMEGIIFLLHVPLDLGFWWAINIEEIIIVSCRYSPQFIQASNNEMFLSCSTKAYHYWWRELKGRLWKIG